MFSNWSNDISSVFITIESEATVRGEFFLLISCPSLKFILLKTKSKFVESLPEYIIKEYKLLDKNSAIINIHLPKSSQVLSKAIKRLKFE